MAQVTKHILSAFRPKTFTPHPRRAMSSTLQNLTPRTGTPSSPFPESVFQQFEQPCEDQRPQQSGALTELPPLIGEGWLNGESTCSCTVELKAPKSVPWQCRAPCRNIVGSLVVNVSQSSSSSRWCESSAKTNQSHSVISTPDQCASKL